MDKPRDEVLRFLRVKGFHRTTKYSITHGSLR
jgi:hypothetical protein